MYKLEFTLKQHTPIIHFQHDQDGATLRATEVKPKLDRFIIDIIGGKDKVSKNYFNAFEHGSLDYKIKIQPSESQKINIQDNNSNTPLYFGNMGNDRTSFKHLKLEVEPFIVIIQSFNEDLINILQENIFRFFFLHNFGTRQSKGYGGFMVTSINSQSDFPKNDQSDFSFDIEADNWQTALIKLNIFYKALRSGINEVARTDESSFSPASVSSFNGKNVNKRLETNSDFYLKPAIFLYAKSKGKQWDKKSIKSKFYDFDYSYRFANRKGIESNKEEMIEELAMRKQIEKHEISDILSFSQIKDQLYDFKDLFGLSSDESWRSYGDSIKKAECMSNNNPNLKDEKQAIQRFKSPITFKVINQYDEKYKVYIFISDIDPNYKGAYFKISNKFRKNLVLQIPTDFSFKFFFDFIKKTENYNLDSLVSENSRNYVNRDGINIYKTLLAIIQQFQSSNHG